MPTSGSATELYRHWYSVVNDDSLRQGDIFRDLVVPILPAGLKPITPAQLAEGSAIDIEGKAGDWIVFSASCDLVVGRSVLFAIVGRVVSLEEALGPGKARDRRQRAEIMRRGLMPSKFRLAEHPRVEPPFADSIVDYRVHVTVPVSYLRHGCTGPRLRLMPPFREQFGNWVASNVSRVGIEDDAQIPRDTVGTSDTRLLEMVDAEEANTTEE